MIHLQPHLIVFTCNLILRIIYLFLFCHRCVRFVGRQQRGMPTREGPMRSGGIRTESVPEPTHSLRQAATASTVTTARQLASYRTALLCASRRQDADRDAHSGHVTERGVVQLALHAATVASEVPT